MCMVVIAYSIFITVMSVLLVGSAVVLPVVMVLAGKQLYVIAHMMSHDAAIQEHYNLMIVHL